MYDAIIVGSRIAGATTAALLGARGHRVLLVDRADFPSTAISTHFFGGVALEFMDKRLGVLEEVLATGAPPLRRNQVTVQDVSYSGPIMPRTPYSYSLNVRRQRLDDILLGRALREKTVEFRPRTIVQRLLWEGDRVAGVAGDGWEARAPVVVGADGRHSTVARLVNVPFAYHGETLRCSYHAYWEDVMELPIPSFEFMYWDSDILQVGQCEDGAWVLFISSPQAEFDMLRRGHVANYESRLKRIPTLAARLRNARRISPVYGCGDLLNFRRKASGAGWALVGDACCFKDPLMGAGIWDALRSGDFLAAAIHRALVREQDWEQALAQYATEHYQLIGRNMEHWLESLKIKPVKPSEKAWLTGVLGHVGFGLDLAQHTSSMIAGLPKERQEFWRKVAEMAATAFGLPSPAAVPDETEGLLHQTAD